MAFQSWSVVYGEQPSASKWNILGTNDASFNDGTGIANDTILATHTEELPKLVNRQDNTTDNTVEDQLVQVGWGFIIGDTTVGIQEAVTFPVAYDSAPIVICNYCGTSSTDPALISDLSASAADTNRYGRAMIITTTGFTAGIVDVAGSSASVRYGYTWIAIGSKAR